MNPFDSFDVNPFDDFDEKKQKSSGLYKESYKKYLASVKERQDRVSIPGAELADKAPPKSYEEYANEKDKGIIDSILGPFDVALTVASSPLAALNAVGGAAASAIRGKEGFLPAYERIYNNTMWTPKTDAGEDILNALNPVLGALPAVGGYVGPLGRMRRSKAVPKETNFDTLVNKEQTPIVESQPTIQAPELRLESPVAAEIRVAQQNKRMPKAEDYNNRDANVRAVEEEIAAMEALQKQQAEEALAKEQAATHEFLRDAQQTVIDDTPFGDRPAQYGMTDEFGRVDENGIPIRADLSMDAQNVQNPLQRNLWGDELPMRTGDKGLPLTQALDKMPEGLARDTAMEQLTGQPTRPLDSQVIDVLNKGMSGSQRGALNMDIFDPFFRREKDLPNGLRLVFSGDTENPTVKAFKNGREVGELRLEADTWFNPTADSNMRAQWVETTKSPVANLAPEMYKFVAELGNDVVPSKIQTPDGKAMWERFEKGGLASNRMIRGQRGALDFEALSQKLKDMGFSFPRAGEIEIKPRPVKSAEQVAKTTELRQKANAVGLKGTPYDRITTLEDALADPGKDVSSSWGRDELVSGVEGMVRLHEGNNLLKFARATVQDARNAAETMVKKYLTNNKDGLTVYWSKLSQKERNDVIGLWTALDKYQKPLTETVMAEAGFNENQKAFLNKAVEATDALYASKAEQLGLLGFEPHQYRKGYMPALFDGAYRTLIGTRDKDGNFSIKAVAQADTKIGHAKALEYYKQELGDKVEYITLPRKKLPTSAGHGRSNLTESLNSLLLEVAKRDTAFAEVKAVVDQKMADHFSNLYNFQVHEKMKKGVEGAIGKRPWLEASQNTNEFMRAFMNYMEEGFRYTNYQKPLNDISTMTGNPELRDKFPNTMRYLDKYQQHLAGGSLNAIGGAGNALVDSVAKSLAIGNGKINALKHELTHWSSLHMMGGPNLGFFAMQLTQILSGGMPEAAALRNRLGMDVDSFTQSLTSAPINLVKLAAEDMLGRPADVPQHMRDAYQWAHDVGMFTFSEAELAHQVNQGKIRKRVDQVLGLPIEMGEKMTRPTIFMLYADMFHKEGYTGIDGLSRAQAATEWAMANYHPDERPMVYQNLGVVGHLAGALATYKHNFVGQLMSRTKSAQKDPMALMLTGALGFGLYGLMGFPGAQEMTELAEYLTDKPVRNMILDSPTEPNAWMDGLLSASTGLDFQSRLSQSSLFPDTPLSMFPHISNIATVMDKAYQVAKTGGQDMASWEQLGKQMLPSGARGIIEDDMSENPRTGMNKYATPRSEEEQKWRAVMGIKPLREKLADDRTWANSKIEKRRDDAIRDAQTRYDRAILGNDTSGMAKAKADYIKNGGDIRTLLDSNRIQQMLMKSQMSEEQRKAGIPGNNINQINQFNQFTPGQ